jgi:hypothetical protein
VIGPEHAFALVFLWLMTLSILAALDARHTHAHEHPHEHPEYARTHTGHLHEHHDTLTPRIAHIEEYQANLSGRFAIHEHPHQTAISHVHFWVKDGEDQPGPRGYPVATYRCDVPGCTAKCLHEWET